MQKTRFLSRGAAGLGVALIAFSLLPQARADDAALVAAKGTLLFSDDFQRDESTPDKEEIGGGWTSNSAWRAGGRKQADLRDGFLLVTMDKAADHGVALFHDAPMRDGAVSLRVRLQKGEDLSLDFNDVDLKTVHAGHLCVARITLDRLTLTDTKTGAMDLKIRERRLAGEKSPELDALLKGKSGSFPLKLEPDAWHELLVVIQGDVMRASVDGKLVGELKSEGIAHPTKKRITLGVNKVARVDDVKAWALK